MTLGRKLANYRKLAGLTQQQLGERLNLSAQAISKWEKDLTEPDLATLRVLADLYKVTVDELLDLNSGFQNPNAGDAEVVQEEKLFTQAIGFCKECGMTVTEENLGTTEPAVLCKKCVAAGEERVRRAAEQERRKRAAAAAASARELEERRSRLKKHRAWAFSVSALVGGVFLLLVLLGSIDSFGVGDAFFMLIGTYVVFSFIFCLFYDCVVQDVVVDWFGKSFDAPGLIFTFDADGCLWYIGMKILFFVLGAILAVLAGIVGITLGLICAPFVFPFVLRNVNRGVKNGEEDELYW